MIKTLKKMTKSKVLWLIVLEVIMTIICFLICPGKVFQADYLNSEYNLPDRKEVDDTFAPGVLVNMAATPQNDKYRISLKYEADSDGNTVLVKDYFNGKVLEAHALNPGQRNMEIERKENDAETVLIQVCYGGQGKLYVDKIVFSSFANMKEVWKWTTFFVILLLITICFRKYIFETSIQTESVMPIYNVGNPFKGIRLLKTTDFIVLVAFVGSMGSLFYYMWPSFLTIHDDLVEYIYVNQGIAVQHSYDAAVSQGRIWFIINNFFEYLPMLAKNYTVYKCFSYLGVLIVVYSIFKLLYRHGDKNLAIVTALLYVALSQLDGQHNSLVAYVFWRQIDTAAILLAIERFLTYYKSDKKTKCLVQSALLYLFAAILYESFILFAIIFAMIAVIYEYEKGRPVVQWAVQTIKDLWIHAALAGAYLVIYILWRVKYPSLYVGAKLDASFEMQSTLITMLKLGFGKFPVYTSIDTLKKSGVLSIKDFAKYISVDQVVVALLVTCAVAICITRIQRRIRIREIAGILCICGVAVCLQTVLYGLTPQYKNWVVYQGVYSYLTSNSSYIYILIGLVIVVVALYQRIRWKKTLTLVLMTIVFSGTLVTGVNNKIYAKETGILTKHYQAYDYFVKSELYDSVAEGAQIYIPEFAKYSVDNLDLTQYANTISKKDVSYVRNEADIDWSSTVYYYYMNEDTRVVIFAHMRPGMQCDEVWLLNPSQDTYVVYLDTDGSMEGIINGANYVSTEDDMIIGINGDDYVNIQTKNINLNRSFTFKSTEVASNCVVQ